MPLTIPHPLRRDAFARLQFLAENASRVPNPKLPAAVQAAMDAIALDALVPRSNHRDLFFFKKEVMYLNNGSFGAVPRSVQNVRKAWMDVFEEESVDFHFEFDPFIAWALKELCTFVNADPLDVVFVENATAGTNTVLKSLKLGPQHTILGISFAYPAVSSTIQFISENTGCKVFNLRIPLPTSTDAIIRQFEEYFRTSCATPTVAVFDHITSATGLVLPIRELAAICRRNGVLSVIDGAHAVGQVPIDLEEVDPDYYVTNVHKWCFAPRGCAILYAKRKHHPTLHHLYTSYSYTKGLQAEFYWPGTHDSTLFLTVPAALAFFKHVLGSSYDRNTKLNVATARFLTRVVPGARLLTEDESMLAMMATIVLPRMMDRRVCQVNRVSPDEWKGKVKYRTVLDAEYPTWIEYPEGKGPAREEELTASVVANAVHDTLRSQYAIEGWCNVVEGEVILRISVQTYNKASEYVALAQALVEIQEGDGVKLSVDEVKRYATQAEAIESEYAVDPASRAAKL